MHKIDHLGAKISAHPSTAVACQSCGRVFKDFDKVYDCPSRQGPWAYFCIVCAQLHARPSQGTVHVHIKGDN